MPISPAQEALIRTAVDGMGKMFDTEARVGEQLIEPLAGKIADMLFPDPKMHADMIAAGKQLHGIMDNAIHTAEIQAPIALNAILDKVREL